MRKVAADSVPYAPVAADGAVGCEIGELIAAREGAPTFAMRRFRVAPGGHTPFHRHEWEHEVYVLAGTGAVRLESRSEAIGPGDAVLILPNEQHSFENTGDVPLEFLCLIPVEQTCCR